MPRDKSKLYAKQKEYRDREDVKVRRNEYMRNYMAQRRADARRVGKSLYNPEYSRERNKKLRAEVFEVLGGAKCVNCGCTEVSILEVNHINGGGNRELKQRQTRKLLYDILAGREDVKKFNVLCRVCNALHYVRELLGVKGHQVIWRVGRIG